MIVLVLWKLILNHNIFEVKLIILRKNTKDEVSLIVKTF